MHGVMVLKFAQLKTEMELKPNVWDIERLSTRELMVLPCRKGCYEGVSDCQVSVQLVILEIL